MAPIGVVIVGFLAGFFTMTIVNLYKWVLEFVNN